MNACVKDDLFNGPALISEVTAVPVTPKSSDSVSITARITDLKGIATAILAYRASAQGTFTSLAMQHETPTNIIARYLHKYSEARSNILSKSKTSKVLHPGILL